jgi:PAS domain S-box-containing protein
LSSVAEPRAGGEGAHASEFTSESKVGAGLGGPASARPGELRTLYDFTDRLLRAESPAAAYDAALTAIIDGLACDRASILVFDDAGVMRFVASRNLSETYRAAVDGHSPWKRGQRDAQPIFIPDVFASHFPPELKETMAREGLGALIFIPIVADGGVIGKFMAYYDAPHAFRSGHADLGLTIARQLGFSIEHTLAEQARQRLISIIENSDDAIVSKDLSGIINSWNRGAQRLFGYAPHEIVGRSVLTLIPPELQHEEPDIIRRISAGQRIEHFETVRVRKNGERVHISLTVSPVKDAAGQIIGASKIARDITERKRAEQQRTLLINELNHRVKNTLATVQSLAMQTLRSTERSEDARALFDSRLSALSRAHDLLTQENWEGASLAEVVERALSPFRTPANRIRAQGSFVRLTPTQALALSIALHELATNAAKYGALSGDAGMVDVVWSTGEGMLRLSWTETGGPLVTPPTRAGFGSRLIQRNLAAELGGSAVIDYRPQGVFAEINAPIEAQKRAGL